MPKPEPAWLPRWRMLKDEHGLTFEQAFAVWVLMDDLHLFNYAWLADNALKQLRAAYGIKEVVAGA